MIPRAYITEWQRRVPWPELYQVEQDLILSRLMIEITTNELLGPELVMRGGTCLHKLHLAEPRRYSEDLDYVRRGASGFGPYLDELRAIAADVGLSVSHVDFSGPMVHLMLDAEPTVGPGQIRIKVETNIAETDYFAEPQAIDYVVESRWWSGAAAVWTFGLDEMMATKLRALYQRSKGRDLFDLWLVLTTEDVDPRQIAAGLHQHGRRGVHLSAAKNQSRRQDCRLRLPRRPRRSRNVASRRLRRRSRGRRRYGGARQLPAQRSSRRSDPRPRLARPALSVGAAASARRIHQHRAGAVDGDVVVVVGDDGAP